MRLREVMRFNLVASCSVLLPHNLIKACMCVCVGVYVCQVQSVTAMVICGSLDAVTRLTTKNLTTALKCRESFNDDMCTRHLHP